MLAAKCRSLTLFGMTIYGRTWDPAPCKKTRGAGHPTSTRVQKSESEAADRSVRSTQPLAAFFTSSNWVTSTGASGKLAVIFSSPGRGLRKAWSVVLLAAKCRSLTLFGMTIYGRTWDPAPCKKTRGAGHPTSTRVQKTESEAADRSVRSTQPLAAFFTSSKLGDLDGCFREVGGILVLRAGV